jgi:hypothetical protein
MLQHFLKAPVTLYDKINDLRTRRDDQIIVANPSQAIFKTSWFSRIKPYNANETDTQAIA